MTLSHHLTSNYFFLLLRSVATIFPPVLTDFTDKLTSLNQNKDQTSLVTQAGGPLANLLACYDSDDDSLDDPKAEEKKVEGHTEKLDAHPLPDFVIFSVTEIECKIGNKIYVFPIWHSSTEERSKTALENTEVSWKLKEVL